MQNNCPLLVKRGCKWIFVLTAMKAGEKFGGGSLFQFISVSGRPLRCHYRHLVPTFQIGLVESNSFQNRQSDSHAHFAQELDKSAKGYRVWILLQACLMNCWHNYFCPFMWTTEYETMNDFTDVALKTCSIPPALKRTSPLAHERT